MNKIINKFFLTGDKFMPELHLKRLGFTDSVCVSVTKHRERILKSRETGNLKHLCRNEASFTHAAAYSESKDIEKRIISDMILKNRVYEIARAREFDGYQRTFTSMVYKIFDKKAGSGISVNEQLGEE